MKSAGQQHSFGTLANTIQYNTIQSIPIQYNPIQCKANTIQYNAIQYNTPAPSPRVSTAAPAAPEPFEACGRRRGASHSPWNLCCLAGAAGMALPASGPRPARARSFGMDVSCCARPAGLRPLSFLPAGGAGGRRQGGGTVGRASSINIIQRHQRRPASSPTLLDVDQCTKYQRQPLTRPPPARLPRRATPGPPGLRCHRPAVPHSCVDQRQASSINIIQRHQRRYASSPTLLDVDQCTKYQRQPLSKQRRM
eukprot:gene19964-biopygen4054